MAKTYTREYFQRMGRKGAKLVDSTRLAAALRESREQRLRRWCAEEDCVYDTLPTDERGKKLLPDTVKAKYVEWRFGWKPGKRKKTTNHRKIKAK